MVALLATFALQMGLLIVLWKALTTGSKTGISTPDDIFKDMLEKKLSLLVGTVDQVRDETIWLRRHALTNNSSPTAEPKLNERDTTNNATPAEKSLATLVDEAEDRANPSVANLLAFLALVVYVQEEIRKAVWLSYVAAAYSRILPLFYQTDASVAARPVGVLPLWCRVVVLGAPLLQLVTGCMVLITSMLLSLHPETQQTLVTIVLSNVALSFIVDIGNRVGAMLASQQQIAASLPPVLQKHSHGGISDPALCTALGQPQQADVSASRNVCGHCFMNVVGFCSCNLSSWPQTLALSCTGLLFVLIMIMLPLFFCFPIRDGLCQSLTLG